MLRPCGAVAEQSAKIPSLSSSSLIKWADGSQWPRDDYSGLRALLTSHENDRKLIAYELHDTFVQLAVGAKINVETYVRLRDNQPEKAENSLTTAFQLLGSAIDEARRVIGGLRPAVLDEVGIVAALGDMLSGYGSEGNPRFEFSLDVRFDRMPLDWEIALFRILQEAVANSRRHSQSEKVHISLADDGHRVRAVVEDWGVGFDVHVTRPGHFGLGSMRERARLFGGHTRIDSRPGFGTRVEVELPFPPSAMKPQGDAARANQ